MGSELTIPDRKRLEIARASGRAGPLIWMRLWRPEPDGVHEAIELVKTSSPGDHLFIIEHVMEASLPIADRIVVLDAGRLSLRAALGDRSQREGHSGLFRGGTSC